ncbi:MAG: O-succinylhomoserine sulfhydrylase [Alphaproteobacteria bacterium]|nr:O-succinylhomoserine sulfhydrylase [Alphaproteobacteria bacterium]
MTNKPWHKDTLSVRGGLRRSQFDETSEGLFLNSGYVYPSAEDAEAAFKGDLERFVYSRFGNPTVAMLQDRLAALEGAEAGLVTGTGMAAMFAAVASVLNAGDRIVASRALFGACYSIIDQVLPRWGVEREFVDGTSLEAWQKALSRPAQIVFLESPSNPMLDIVDIKAVAEMAHAAGAMVVVDNVFATPTGQSPIELGADVVMYSLTKFHDGHGRVMGGALLGRDEFINGDLLKFFRMSGPVISPFNAWVILKSLESMSLRVERQARNAARIAAMLADHPMIDAMRYPHHPSHPQHELAMRQMNHGGPLVTFNVKGGKPAAFAMMNALEVIDISNNLGDSKTLICHPYSTTHSSLSEAERMDMGITEGTARLSAGVEHIDDLIGDLTAALDKA